MIPRPETPPPSTHRLEIPISPETPTPTPVHNISPVPTASGASLFHDDEDTKPIISQPSTPVLYNLIRNEGPPKFVIAPTQQMAKIVPSETKDIMQDEEESLHPPSPQSQELTLLEMEGFGGDMLRGHPSACLFVARSPPHARSQKSPLTNSLNSMKSEDQLRKSVTDLFSKVTPSHPLLDLR